MNDQEVNGNIENKVKNLLAAMTLEEKVGQMTQIDFSVIAGQGDTLIDQSKLLDAILTHHVGSILNTPNNKAQSDDPDRLCCRCCSRGSKY